MALIMLAKKYDDDYEGDIGDASNIHVYIIMKILMTMMMRMMMTLMMTTKMTMMIMSMMMMLQPKQQPAPHKWGDEVGSSGKFCNIASLSSSSSFLLLSLFLCSM